MLNDSDLVVGFDDLPPFCLELKGMSMGQDLVTSFTTPDFVKGNTYASYFVRIFIVRE